MKGLSNMEINNIKLLRTIDIKFNKNMTNKYSY
jgi:hypothetical protein